ncbi:GAF domain-like protein [Tuber indicum]|nr:GAF domain-like protein [Tuber indicum]
MVVTGVSGSESVQRCEDEPIHIPRAAQGFGVLIALKGGMEGGLDVKIVSENSKQIIGYSPAALFALGSFCNILSEEQAENLYEHLDFFELEDNHIYPLFSPAEEETLPPPKDTLNSNPSEQDLLECTLSVSRPLRVLRHARKRRGQAAVMEVFNLMSQIQEQLSSASTLVVKELVDPRATKDLYKGLHFPASDIPKQARDLYLLNKVRLLYDRDQVTARLVCKSKDYLDHPLDMTHSYLRAISPIHIKYLKNMATYRETASKNIERLSYASRLQARKLINTVPTEQNHSGYIIASSDDLLKLFDVDFGLLSIREETEVLGKLEHSRESFAMLEYLRMRKFTSVLTSQNLSVDFPDLNYEPGFSIIAGLLLVPLSVGGQDFIVFFRKGQLWKVNWAGNPYEKSVKEGTKEYLEPRESFKTWSETAFIEVWRQKETALQTSQLTRLLLANAPHEVRTPLDAIINCLEIALESPLDNETRDNLMRSHSAYEIWVAEDNPINSKMGHGVVLTVNGEECADLYSKHGQNYDIVLMDMQASLFDFRSSMPIMDGGTPATRICQFEGADSDQRIPTRHRINRRVPIFVVSASLAEERRAEYIDFGFDGWILKPVNFGRLKLLLDGIRDPAQGGWFSGTPRDTKPLSPKHGYISPAALKAEDKDQDGI